MFDCLLVLVEKVWTNGCSVANGGFADKQGKRFEYQ